MSVNRISPEDLLALSAYLDGALDPPERSSLERRLAVEPLLRAELESLRDTVNLIKSLPHLKAPRDFTLTPAMLGGGSVSHNPKIVRLARFNRWQVASIATLAASILLVFIGLFAGFGDTASPNTDANEAFQLSEPSVDGEVVEDGIFKPPLTPTLDLGSVLDETTAASSSAPAVPGVMGTPQSTIAVAAEGDSAEGPAPAPPSGETGLLPNEESEGGAGNEGVIETQVAQSPVNPSAAIPQSGQAGAVANNPTAETMGFAAAPTATAQPNHPTSTFVSATKVAGDSRSDDTAAPSEEPAPETGRAEFDSSVDEDEEFEVNALLIIGLVGVIASILVLAYTWRKR